MKLGWAVLIFCGLIPAGPLWGQTDASKLLGRWQLRLWVTGPAAESAGLREASGPIEVRRLSTGPVPRGLQWVFSVTYDDALHGMFGPPKSGPARAVLKARDSVALAFNPLIDHGAFRLAGVIRGDSITGTWLRTSFADDGYRGSFTMVRVARVAPPPRPSPCRAGARKHVQQPDQPAGAGWLSRAPTVLLLHSTMAGSLVGCPQSVRLGRPS